MFYKIRENYKKTYQNTIRKAIRRSDHILNLFGFATNKILAEINNY